MEDYISKAHDEMVLKIIPMKINFSLPSPPPHVDRKPKKPNTDQHFTDFSAVSSHYLNDAMETGRKYQEIKQRCNL